MANLQVPDDITVKYKEIRTHRGFGDEVVLSVYVKRPDGAIYWAYDTTRWTGQIDAFRYELVNEEWDYHVHRYGGEPAYVVTSYGALFIVTGKGSYDHFRQVE